MDEPATSPDNAVTLVRRVFDRQLLSVPRFKLRLMLLVSLIVVLLTALLFLLVNRVFETLTPTLEHDLEWKTRTGAAELSQSGDLAVLTADQELLERVAERYTQDPDVLYLAFVDANNEVLFQRGNPALAALMGPTGGVPEHTQAAVAVWSPIDVEGLRVGSVRLAVSKYRLQAGNELYRRILVAGLLGALIALGLALAFVNSYIVPILRVTRGAFEELDRTTSMALASAEAKSQFLANMSHEIRTPMNGVLGMVHLVQRTKLDRVQRGYVETIAASARSLLKIVNDILDFSKMEADKYELDPQPCDLPQLLRQTVSLFDGKSREKGLALELTLSANVPGIVVLDGDRLRQVLSNLLSNAIKFTDAGTVSVHVDTLPDPADLATTVPVAGQTTLSLSVADTGLGIPPEAYDRLFRAFSQVDGSSSRMQEGTGLGLAISRKLVELMGGNITHQPRADGGSVFRFAVPVHTCDVPPALPTADCYATRFESPHPILVVDDNEVNQLVAMEILESLGLQVEIVGGGEEAVASVQNGRYALVLMDCQMPGMDGYSATLAIRQQEASGQRVPIVACTAHALKEERIKVRECGMDDYVAKPIEPDELTAMLGRWLKSVPVTVPPCSRPSHASQPGPSAATPTHPAPATTWLESPDLAVLDPARRPSPRVASLFLSNAPAELARLKQSAARGDAGEVGALAHKLKGSAGCIGAARLAAPCDQLQLLAPSASQESLLAAVELIERLFKQVQAGLQEEYTMGDQA